MGLLLVFVATISYAQVGILTTNPSSSAELDIYSGNKGLLVPRLSLSNSLTNSSPVNSPANGLLVFNQGLNQELGFYFWLTNRWYMLQIPDANKITHNGSSTDNAIVRFDGTNGKTIQNSGAILNDNNQISGLNSINLSEFRLTSSPTDSYILTSDASGNASWQSQPPIDVKENNSLIVPNVSKLNFEGGSYVKDEGNNQAKIIFFKKNTTNDIIQLSSSDSIDLNVLSGYIAIPWDVEMYKNANTFTHSTTSNPERIYVDEEGIYEVNYMFSAINKTIKRKTLRARILKNSSSFIPHITSYSFSYHEEDDKITHSSSSFLIELEEGDYIELVVNGQTNNGPIRLIANENLFFLRFIRENDKK